MLLRRAAAFLLLMFPVLGVAAEKPWAEIRSPHFRVLTNGSVPDAGKAAAEFEQMRSLFANRFPGMRLDSGAPLLIFAVRDEDSAKQLERSWVQNRAGEFHHGWERQYAIVVLSSWGGEGSKEVVFHEYTHSIEHMNLHYLPLWLDEGTAEFYGYTRFQGSEIYLGAPTERYRTLRNRQPIPVESFITVNQRSPYYLDSTQNQLYYAQAWALVHYLIYGKDMENGKRLNQFVDLLQTRIDQKKAFQQVFGDFKKIDKDLAAYMQQPTFAASRIRDLPKVDEKSFSIRTTSLAETEAELGIFHLWSHNREAARTLVDQALKDDPKLGLAHEANGFVDFSEGKDSEAQQEFTQAAALDGALYLSQYYKTMLSALPHSDRESDLNAYGAALGKVLQLKPDFAPAYVQLAKLAVREGDLNAALQIAKKAEDLEPSLAGYHLLTGRVLQRMGKAAEAGEYAKYVADRWVGPDHDEAVELWSSLPPVEGSTGEMQLTSLPNTKVAEGKIKSLTCGEPGKGESVVVDHDGADLTFHRKGGAMTGFSDTLWYGGDHFNLCHHLEGMRAVVNYRAPSDETYAGDIVELGVRDDLPPSLVSPTTTAKP